MSATTVQVHENNRTGIVRYTGTSGKVFRLKIVQKSNPIGFTARLPGDPARPSAL